MRGYDAIMLFRPSGQWRRWTSTAQTATNITRADQMAEEGRQSQEPRRKPTIIGINRYNFAIFASKHILCVDEKYGFYSFRMLSVVLPWQQRYESHPQYCGFINGR